MLPVMSDAESAVPVPPPGAADRGTEPEPAAPDAALVRYSVPEAARAIGISERAVRKRIDAGTIQAERVGRAWSVVLPAVPGTAVRAVPAAPVIVVAEPTGPEVPLVAAQAAVPGGTDLAPLVDHIADLERRVERLTESSTVWQVRALQAEERLKQLTAGDVAPQDAAEATPVSDPTPVASPMPWWRFWERR